MLEKQKIEIGKQIVKICVQLPRVFGKNNFVSGDLEKINRVSEYLEKSEWVLKTIEDDKNFKTI